RKKEVEGAVTGTGLNLPSTLAPTDDMLEITIAGDEGMEEAVVWWVSFSDRAEVDIGRGGCEGKRIGTTQIVTDRQAVGMWAPDSGAHFKLPLSEVLTDTANGAVVMVQQERDGLPGRILGAASFTR